MSFSLLYCLVPKSHLVSLSWWEEVFLAEREALSVLAAEHCEASMMNTGILAGGNTVGFACRPQFRVMWIPKGKG